MKQQASAIGVKLGARGCQAYIPSLHFADLLEHSNWQTLCHTCSSSAGLALEGWHIRVLILTPVQVLN